MLSFLDLVFLILFGRVADPPAIETLGRMEKPHHIVMEAMASSEFSAPPIASMRHFRELSPEELDGIREYFPESHGTTYAGYTKEAFITEFLNAWLARAFRSDGRLTYIQMKSLPRSGHHFIIVLLQDYFQAQAHYCERYIPENCCHNIPCVRPFTENFSNHYMIQKSHDFQLNDIKSNAFKYIIQHRAIVTRVQSNFELAIRNPMSGFEDTREDFQRFSRGEAEQTVEFYKKWVLDDDLSKCVITYEELVDQTEKTLDKVIRHIEDDPAVDNQSKQSFLRTIKHAFEHRKRISHALKLKSTKVNTFNSPAGTRKPTEHRYFDKAFCLELEQRVHTQCPTVAVEYYFL